MNGQEKAKFRRSKIWKEFRLKLIKERKCCQFCGSKFRMNVHHKKPDDYTNLDPNDFLLLCNGCHKYWELKLSIKDKSHFIPEFISIIEKFTGK